ncbi:ankyrin repeat-containing domain protein [Tuber brumale]|nr:ankyrin repeat-containing domain protein [Tuber brumale]
MSFLSLPNEMFLEIASWLPLADQNSLLRTNKHLAQLLQYGLINTVFQTKSAEVGQRVLFAFASRGDISGVCALLDRGICSFIPDSDSLLTRALETQKKSTICTTIRTLLKCGFQANEVDHRRRTPLLYAVSHGMRHIIYLLLSKSQYDVCVNGPPMQRTTPLIAAIERGSIDIVRVLLKHPHIMVNALSRSGHRAIEAAIDGNQTAALKLLLDDDRVDISSASAFGETPLMQAIGWDNIRMVRLMLQSDRLNLLAPTPFRHNVLHLAARLNDTDCTILRMILADPRITVDAINEVCECGNTPLHTASIWNKRAAVEILVRDGRADVNARNREGKTPLAIAARVGNRATVRMLLEDPRIVAQMRGNRGRRY